MVYTTHPKKDEKGEYVGEAYHNGYKIVAYRRNGFIYVYRDNDKIGSYPTSEFTIMEAFRLAASGWNYANEREEIEEYIREEFINVNLTDVKIIGGNLQYEYRL